MMNKKYLNIILIIIVLSIWGKVILNYSKRFTTPKVQPLKTVLNTRIEKKIVKKYKIKELARDPFLNKIEISKKRSKISKSIPKKNIFNWPKISYRGYIRSKTKKTKLAILNINNKIIHANKNEEIFKGIIIKKIYKDSIILKNKNINKTIIK